MITHLAHVTVTVPDGTFHLAEEFYGKTLGLSSRPVPHLQKETLRWFDIGSSGQQVHVAFGTNRLDSYHHPCFHVESADALLALQNRAWEHYERGGAAAPMSADKPGEIDSGDKGIEYPQRFFTRDYAGNRLEFSL